LLDQAAAQPVAPLARLRRHEELGGLVAVGVLGEFRQLQDGDAVAVLRRQLVVVDGREQEARPGDELLGLMVARPAQRARARIGEPGEADDAHDVSRLSSSASISSNITGSVSWSSSWRTPASVASSVNTPQSPMISCRNFCSVVLPAPDGPTSQPCGRMRRPPPSSAVAIQQNSR
jgi:hypothetical protein